MSRHNEPPKRLEICILAGGRSKRMGRDKASLRLGGHTVLSRIRAAARATGLTTRIIRHDLLPGCGPLGGIFTALKTSRTAAILFLACDMPLITPRLLRRVIRAFDHTTSLFVCADERPGFPFLLTSNTLPVVKSACASRGRSLHALAKALNARLFRAPNAWRPQLLNANTPEEWDQVRQAWKRLRRTSPKPRLQLRKRRSPLVKA